MRVRILGGLMIAMLALTLSSGVIFAGPLDVAQAVRLLAEQGNAAAQSAEAPSFNCAKATYPDERTICSSAELSQLDNVANAGYQYVRRVYGSQYANSLDLPLLDARRACATDVTCIKAQQLAAIKNFQSLGAPINALPAAPSFNCAKATYLDERTICSSAELSQLDNVANAGYQYVRRVYGSQYANSLDLPLLDARRACANDVTCIKAQQLAAIKKFQSLGAPINALPAALSPPPNPRGEQLGEPFSALVTTSVPMRIEGGTYVVPVLINDAITLDFIVDSGAADVSNPADVVMTLMRTKTLKDTDFLGEQTYVLADGSKVPSQTFVIRSLKVGDKVLENVNGSVASVHGSLLLGQTFLSRFKSWSVDNTKHALVLSE